MQPTTPTTQEEARQQATDWQSWQAEQSLSYGAMLDWQNHFNAVAKQYPELTDEFKENGII